MWIQGDLHVHSNCCGDGTLAVDEIVERSREFSDFIAISGHSRNPQFWRSENQYAQVCEARKKFDMPIFCTGEIEFPIPRHAMVLTTPDDREFELLSELVARFCRYDGIEGADKALELLDFVEKNWHDNCFMIFNHPNAPDVSLEDLQVIAKSPVFKVLACVDRGERRAPQTWDVGAEWDQLLMQGARISTRCGSDFHQHFTDGGHDYYPGEFVQDCLQVKKNDYADIIQAYRSGNYYTMCGNLIAEPEFTVTPGDGKNRMHLAFDLNGEMEFVEVISDGKVIARFTDFSDRFAEDFDVPTGKYYRVRGMGKLQKRKYSDGEFEPLFLLNPIYM